MSTESFGQRLINNQKDFQDGGHLGCVIGGSQLSLSVQEKKFKIIFQDDRHGFQIKTI